MPPHNNDHRPPTDTCRSRNSARRAWGAIRARYRLKQLVVPA